MRLRTALTSIALTVLTLVSGTALLQAQAPDSQTSKKIFGYQDPATGTFHALPMSAPAENASTTLAGTLKVTLNITVKSSWPANSTRQFVCGADFVEDSVSAAGSSTYSEAAYRYPTATAGGWTCTLTIPYSWLIPSTSIQNTLLGTYSVEVENSTTTAGPPLLRLATGPVVSLSTLPANGVTTSYVIAVTI